MKIRPTISVNIINTCHVGFHVDISSTENVIDCNPKSPSCEPKVGASDTLAENSRVLKSHGLMALCNVP